jgi:tetrathionate reductase subunit B
VSDQQTPEPTVTPDPDATPATPAPEATSAAPAAEATPADAFEAVEQEALAEAVAATAATAGEPAITPQELAIPPVEDAPADAELVPLEALAPAITAASTSRRAFLGFGLALAGGVAGAAILAKFTPVFADEPSDAAPIIPTYDPANRKWTYVVDTAACIGCGLCVAACKEENDVPEEAEFTRTWIERHTITTDGDLHIDSPDAGINGFPYDSTAASAAGKTVEQAYFMPRLCMQCTNSPCTTVCPVSATYRTVDGVILVDARRCIGCGYCVVACPYGARYLVPAGDRAPNDTPGVADKCTWCYHRISRNQVPACVEVCPVGARKFGDATDPNSDISRIVADPAATQYLPEYGTDPRVRYLGPVTREA